jgi:VIT1/CCC1 family predicted Fe2+/Mn2+ transporter
MAAVAYTSTYSRLRLYSAEREREVREMREVPELEREEVRTILRGWGFEGEEMEEMLRRIEAKPKAWLDLMMAFELNLSEVGPHQPRDTALVVFGATLTGSIIPLLPFLVHLGSISQEAIAAVVLSGITLFAIGWYEARVTLGRLWVNGPRMLLIGLGAGFAGFLAGSLLHAF